MKVYLDDERATPEGWHRVYCRSIGFVMATIYFGQVQDFDDG